MLFGPPSSTQMVLREIVIELYQPLRRYRQKAVAALYSKPIKSACTRYGVPLPVGRALIGTESGWVVDAVSPAGAIGLTQLLPSTARDLGVNPWDPVQNIDGGIRYLAQQFMRFGTWELAFAAYNSGPARVARLGRVPRIPETQAYIARAMEMIETGEPWR